MTGPAPVHGPQPALTSHEPASGTGGPAQIRECGKCRQLRPETALVPVDGGGWQCREPCRNPGGRPPVGPPVLIRMPQELREAVQARGRPGESLAATARRLLSEAVTEPQDPAPARDPGSCPDCGGPRKMSLGNVAMCERCGGIWDMAATPEATAADAVHWIDQSTGIDGPRGVLVQTWRGLAVVGPVHTDKGVRQIRAEIEGESETRTPWTVLGQIRMITKARLPWERSKWGS